MFCRKRRDRTSTARVRAKQKLTPPPPSRGTCGPRLDAGWHNGQLLNIGAAAKYATHCVAIGDVNGDGLLDLYAGNVANPNQIHLNQGRVLGRSNTGVWSNAYYKVKFGFVDFYFDVTNNRAPPLFLAS